MNFHNVDRRTESALGGAILMIALAGILSCASHMGTPTADAGGDQNVLVGDTVHLDGSGSTNVLRAAWTITSVPAGSTAVPSLADSAAIQTSFVADKAGVYTVQLSINSGAATATATITAKNVVAKISNGSSSCIVTRTRFGIEELAMDLGAACGILSAEESRGTIASYNWEQIDGPDSSATSATNTATLAFTAPTIDKFQTIGLVETDRGGQADQFKWQPLPIARNATSLFFRLTVTDADGLTDADEVKVFLQDT
ncbi:MAG: hypothetical protein V1798_06600, partial [Pseudomonadota bacterium]